MDNKRKMIISSLLLAGVCSLVLCEKWTASVVHSLEALDSSCVVVPCSFSHPRGTLPTSRLRGIWHHKDDRNKIIYHDDNTKIFDSFKERTKLLGHLGQGNCTLEIMAVKSHDNGPFCFRVELAKSNDNKPTTDMFSFVKNCVEITMLYKPPQPKLGPFKMATPEKPFTTTCSVHHTCPSRMPQLTWNKGTTEEITEIHKDLNAGMWETQSILTFIPQEKDDGTELTCTALFTGGKQSHTSLMLNVKRIENHNHIIIPVAVAFATALLFGGLCILMVKKYKTRIEELQNQDGSMWNRMSRMSRRLRSGGRTTDGGPSGSEQRRSILARFSRRPPRDNWNEYRSPNNAFSKSCSEQKVSKPRLPSPKSQPKSYNYNEHLGDDDYTNIVDLDIYGNV